MMTGLDDVAFATFLLFCRIGGCMMLAPGLSSRRIPMQFRLLLAVAMALGLSTLLAGEIVRQSAPMTAEDRLAAIVAELAAGVVIGLLARLFILAVEFAATAGAAAFGLAGIPGVPLDELESGSPLATLASLAATALIVMANLHAELIRAVIDSYTVFPAGLIRDPHRLSSDLLETLSQTTILSLRLAAPFLAYGIIVNMALGLANRFAPQVTVYHATTGLVMIGGMGLFWLIAPDWLALILDTYGSWLSATGS